MFLQAALFGEESSETALESPITLLGSFHIHLSKGQVVKA
jgi:hypothetical protein